MLLHGYAEDCVACHENLPDPLKRHRNSRRQSHVVSEKLEGPLALRVAEGLGRSRSSPKKKFLVLIRNPRTSSTSGAFYETVDSFLSESIEPSVDCALVGVDNFGDLRQGSSQIGHPHRLCPFVHMRM